MRVLLFDETIEGHHGMWMEEVARVLASVHDGDELFYAFPTPLNVKATHIPCREPLLHRLLRLVTRKTGHPIHVAQCWSALDQLARHHRIDKVLLLHGDPFLHARYVPEPSFDWVPIYFHPTHLRSSGDPGPTASLTAPSCPFVYVLDETVVAPLEQAIGKPVIKIPDFFDPARSGATSRTAWLLDQAAGRPVICAIGPITPHKTVGALLRIAEKRLDWHFLLVGAVTSRRHSRDEMRLLDRAASFSNVTWFPERLDHAELNELTALSDIHYAVYKQFPHSSNKLIRACENRRPLIVADRGYMADVVKRYGIGRTCDDAAVGSIEQAIAGALRSDWSGADWQGYEKNNSIDCLAEALEPFRLLGHR